jgi:hypothetical protein
VIAIATLLLAFVTAPAGPRDPRDIEVVRYECHNDLGRREVTLFENGTIRVRDGETGKTPLMGLAELGPEEMRGFLKRFDGEDLSEIKSLPPGLDGSWVEKCELRLDLPKSTPHVYRFGRYDTLPLNLSRVVRIVDDLAIKVPPLQGTEQLPVDYEPRRGDILKRNDGELFEVFSFSVDGRGVEMQGTRLPLTMYMLKEDLRGEFVALVKRVR